MDTNSISLLNQQEAHFKSDIQKYISQFLAEESKCFLIIEGAAFYVAEALYKLNDDLAKYKSIEQYLGPNNLTFLFWEKPIDNFYNLLVCNILGNVDQQSCVEDLGEIISQLGGASKKAIFISPKDFLNKLKPIKSGMRLLIDEFERKIQIEIYWELYQSLTSGLVEQVGNILTNNFNVNEPLEGTNYLPIHKAIKEGHHNVIYFLLGCGADLSAKNKNGKDAFDLAIGKHDKDIIHIILFKLDVKEWSRKMEHSIQYGDLPVVSVLLQRNFNLDKRYFNLKTQTMLHRAAVYGQTWIARLLIEKGANLNCLTAGTPTGQTPLELVKTCPSIREYLKSMGAKTFDELTLQT